MEKPRPPFPSSLLRQPVEPEAQPVRRGIAPAKLIELVRNTAPFLFNPTWHPSPAERHLQLIRSTATAFEQLPFRASLLDHVQYFELCLAAHHATVATFVPTDVDNTIRYKLWAPQNPLETALAMVDLVLESLAWDYRSVSTRWVASPRTGERVSGHHGEWFSTAVAAYGSVRRRQPQKAVEVLEAIHGELRREQAIFEDLVEARDGIGALKAATLIAHNLGDLDRVIEMWTLPPDDALVVTTFRLGHERQRGHIADLFVAGELNKAMMATENHRHFALRVPRCLRRSADFLLPTAPFLDDWGRKMGSHPELAPEEVGQIAEALIDGWERLAGPIGYSRALAGIEETFPGGDHALFQNLPGRNARKLKAGPLRSLVALPRARFEGQWNQAALKFVDKHRA